VTLADDRVAGDALTTGYASASFNDKHVGNAKPVSVSGISVSGTDAGNYVAKHLSQHERGHHATHVGNLGERSEQDSTTATPPQS
jgi:hypothetical protein